MPDFVLPLSLAASVTAIAACVSYFSIDKVHKFLNPDLKESFLSDSLDFNGVHEDGVTLVGREGSLTRTFIVEGKDYGLCSEEELLSLLKRRGQFFDTVVAKENLSLRVISRRIPVEVTCDGTYENKYLQNLHDRWQTQFKKTYRNIHYIVVTQTPQHGKANFLKQGKALPVEKGKFDESCERIENALDAFKVKTLKCYTGERSQHLSFWASLLNGQDKKVKAFSRHIAERLVSTSIEFDWKAGRIYFDDGVSKKVGAIVSVHQWGDESSSNLFRDLYRLEGSITYLHLIQGVPKMKALSLLEGKESEEGGFFSSITDKASLEYYTAKQVLQDEEGSMHYYQFSMIVMADSEKELSSLIQQTKKTFLSYGTQCVVEKQALEHIWRSQFPGEISFVRKSDLFSHNLSNILTFDKDAIGLKSSTWGSGPLRNFKTINGSSYPLNLHTSERENALGHNLVIAPSESGKTTLIQHIIAGALRHPDLRVYLFDRFNGTKIFTESCGGEYIDIETESGVQLNPFITDDSIASRARLRRLLKLMSGLENTNATEINSVVDLLHGLPKEFRILKNIHGSLLEGKSELTLKIKEWATGPYAHWFNGQKKSKAFDALDLESKRLVGFEMTQVLEEPEAVGPLTYYLMERILSVIREKSSPSWLFIDETKPMLDVPYFKKYVAILLREMRKLNGVVTLCFQDAKDIAESGIGGVIMGQCQTLFLFPNPKASRQDYNLFNLTESEWTYISGNNRTANKCAHTVLVKKPNESVILNIDLSVLGNHINLYSSNSQQVAKIKDLQKKEGDQWVDSYLEG